MNPPSSAAMPWHLIDHDEVHSTSDLTRGLAPWSAVRARRQTGGRGRYGRRFASDEGGLWLSAVLPAGGGGVAWFGFSLVVGLHLVAMLRDLGVPGVRLRWPNDLIARDRKLGGILIEQQGADTLTVGLGLNIANEPWSQDPALRESATRLADVLSPPPDRDALTDLALVSLGEAHAAMSRGGLAAAIPELNRHWSDGRAIELSLVDADPLRGRFLGIDDAGDLRVEDASGTVHLVPPHHVERLRESPD